MTSNQHTAPTAGEAEHLVLTADDIRHWPLPLSPIGRRGYNRNEVHRLLEALADQTDAMQARAVAMQDEIAALTRTLHFRDWEIDQRRHGIGLPSTGPGELIHDDQLNWQMQAQRHNDDITAAAQTQAKQIVEEAYTQAEHVHTQTKRQRGDLNSAHGDLDRLRSSADLVRHHLHEARHHIDTANNDLATELARIDAHTQTRTPGERHHRAHQ
jgi:cell division septum initiation protein DivIVA